MKRRPGNVMTALFLIVVGAWFLATDVFNAPLMGFVELWPAFPLFFGLALLVQYLVGERQNSGLVFLGVAAALPGAFLFLFTLRIGGLTWADMGRYWPAFPLIGGLAFLALYLAGGMQDQGVLVPAFISGGVGLIALPITLGVVGGRMFSQAIRLWPLLLILIGLALFLRFPRRRDGDEDSE